MGAGRMKCAVREAQGPRQGAPPQCLACRCHRRACPCSPALTPLAPPRPSAPAALHNLLLLCIARIAVLLCIGTATCRALYHRRGAHSPPAGASPRSSLVQAAVCLQLVWLAAEVLLGSALLLSRPALNGESHRWVGWTATSKKACRSKLTHAVHVTGCANFSYSACPGLPPTPARPHLTHPPLPTLPYPRRRSTSRHRGRSRIGSSGRAPVPPAPGPGRRHVGLLPLPLPPRLRPAPAQPARLRLGQCVLPAGARHVAPAAAPRRLGPAVQLRQPRRAGPGPHLQPALCGGHVLARQQRRRHGQLQQLLVGSLGTLLPARLLIVRHQLRQQRGLPQHRGTLAHRSPVQPRGGGAGAPRGRHPGRL